MRNYMKFYIDGQWVDPAEPKSTDVINPATEAVSGRISLGSIADIERAVAAARKAFGSWSRSTVAHRLDVLQALAGEYERRQSELADAITEEMGAPRALANGVHAKLGSAHLAIAIEVLKNFKFEELRGTRMIRHEPIGVCGLITPWNWPLNQIAAKVFPAIATGCTCVLKPSQLAPYSAQILTEIIDKAMVPAGVFNMVQGSGAQLGTALSTHLDVDMISFTGSEPVGVQISRDAAQTVKRVCLELGGKSGSIVLDDADLTKNVTSATIGMMANSGQTCSVGSRLLVPAHRIEEAIAAARAAANAVEVGDPNGNASMGPVVSKAQYDSVQGYIQKGLEEGALLIAGGPGRPDGLSKGWFAKPTVFVTTNDTVISREEIFGPVLCIIPYDDVDQAIALANDSTFGLAGYVSGINLEVCRDIGRQLRAGKIGINGAADLSAPFGGYKRSGNGREFGEFGFREYLEVKSMIGYGADR